MRSAMGTVLKVSGWMHNCVKVRYPSFLAVGLPFVIFYQKTRGGCITPPPRPRAAPRRDDWGGGGEEDNLKSILSMHRP